MEDERARRLGPAEVRTYREAVESLFALAVAGDATAVAVEKALRRLTVAEMGMPLAQQQELLSAMIAEYVASNEICPLCGGPPHEEA